MCCAVERVRAYIQSARGIWGKVYPEVGLEGEKGRWYCVHVEGGNSRCRGQPGERASPPKRTGYFGTREDSGGREMRNKALEDFEGRNLLDA